ILYQAGRYEGRAAVKYLARIPDPTLRLFAQIELAAALAGLPQLGGRTITPGPAGFRRSFPFNPLDLDGPSKASVLHPPAPATTPRLTPSYEARITTTRRPREEGLAGGSGPDYWVIQGALLKPVLAALYDVRAPRIDLSPRLDFERYDFALVLP